MAALKIMLVDDHNLVRAGFRSLLQGVAGFEIVAEADNGLRALAAIHACQPDIVLMDIALPDMNGLEVTARIKEEYPQIKVVLLSMYDTEEYVLQAMRIGASGYLLKDSGAAELEFAIQVVARGEAYLSPAISRRVIEGYHQRVAAPPAPAARAETPTGALRSTYQLTPRQRDVLRLIAEGYTTKEIAQQLHLSAKTVDAHRTQLMHELDIHEIAGLVRYAIRSGLVSTD